MALDRSQIADWVRFLADQADDEVIEHDLRALADAFRPSGGPIGLEEGQKMLNKQVKERRHSFGYFILPLDRDDTLYANYYHHPTPPTEHIDLPDRWGWEWAHENEDGSYRGIKVFPRHSV